MALPLPKVVSDVGPGGGLVTSMRGMNALSQDLMDSQIKGVKAQYAPLTTQAEAASKLAYANLMGPQFLAKLMGNPDVVANSPQLQDPATVQKLYQAGMGGGTGNALMNMPGGQGGGNQANSFSGYLRNALKGIFGGSASQPADQGQQSSNPFSASAQQQQPPQQQQQPPQQYGSAPQPQGGGQPVDVNPIIGNTPDSEVAQATTAWMKSPEALAQAQKEGMYKIPEAPQLLQWYRGKQQGNGAAPYASGSPTYAENAAAYEGVKEEGKEAGKIRAQDIKELNDVVYNADTKLATLDDINKMISSPVVREIRQLPLLGRHEMGYYAKEGTPEQQQIVGRLYAQMGNIVKDSSRDFAGQFRKGEQQLLQGMKPNDSDTVDAMIGKSESLTVMTKLLRERSALTSQYMNQYHVNKLQASQMADKQVNGDAIRSQVHDQLNPTVTIRNKRTGEVMTLPAAEAHARMRGQN